MSRSVRSHSSNWSSAIRSSKIRATIARIAASSREARDRTDASTESASMMIAASRDCGFGPPWRNLRMSTASAAFLPSAVWMPPYGSAACSLARA